MSVSIAGMVSLCIICFLLSTVIVTAANLSTVGDVNLSSKLSGLTAKASSLSWYMAIALVFCILAAVFVLYKIIQISVAGAAWAIVLAIIVYIIGKVILK